MESLFAVSDIFWVSRLGSDAVAAVGLTESALSIIYALAMGLATGTTALVSRRIGEQNREEASHTAVQALLLGVVLSVVLGVVGVAFAPAVLSAMGASRATIATGGAYTALMLGGNITIVLLFVGNAIFRGAGDAAAAMRTLWLANGLNIVLGPCFIYGWGPFPAMGVAGAAVGTNIGRGIGIAYQLVSLLRAGRRITIVPRQLRFHPGKALTLLRLGATATLQTLIETLSWAALVRLLATFGSAALAGYTIAMRIAIFALLPAWGMSNAAATLVGQNLGAGQPERAERSVWLVGLYNLGFLGAVGLLFVLLPEPIVRAFTTDREVVWVGVECLRTIAFGFLFFAYGMVFVGAFNGAGATNTPTLINVVCFWLIKIPLAYLLAERLGLGPRGVFIAVTIAYGVQTLTALVIFKRGRWKLRQV
jgi:putative MATE family efflux protein